GKTPLIEPAKADDKDAADKTETPEVQMETAYKHGMKIVFEGDFLSTVDYIRKLENLDWRFFWDSIEFRVEDYPRSLSSITLYTLSLDQNWIGI
ncbi:MAG: hypothetical protein R3318_02135, partial [Gammaproteobacteria bacterium]|nr:hypothetical protein [Gammaproteobacteria bacterium]